MVASATAADAFEAARAAAPPAPGVYFMLNADAELLYIGKAADLRTRLRGHERADARSTRTRLLYDQVREIRWATTPNEASASDREADLIVALRPPYNAAHIGEGRWVYLWVRSNGETMHLTLARAPGEARGGRLYGCFPHLGVGVASPRAIACSEGYVALLRLIWAASDAVGHHYPASIAGPSPPIDFSLPVTPAFRPELHALLSGQSARFLEVLIGSAATREPFLQPGIAGDHESACAFFAHGPRALRALRLRQGVRRPPLGRATIEQLLADEVSAAIGAFSVPELPDPTRGLLGARASKSASVACAARARR